MSHVAPLDLAATAIPGYVLEYGGFIQRPFFFFLAQYSNNASAPLLWLHSEEVYNPSDIEEQLAHTTPLVDWKLVKGAPSPVTLNNLDQLNGHGNTSVYLSSQEGIDHLPSWFEGVKPDQEGRTNGAVSSALILRDHGKGILDAYYFYFYASVIASRLCCILLTSFVVTTREIRFWEWNLVIMSVIGQS
jgi:hypothetical protein